MLINLLGSKQHQSVFSLMAVMNNGSLKDSAELIECFEEKNAFVFN